MRKRRELLYKCVYALYNANMVKIKVDTIKICMEDENCSKKKFAVIVGITEKELDKILSGDLEFKFLSLEKIARFLGVQVDSLLDFGPTEVQTKFYL